MKQFLRNLIATFCATATLGCYSWRPVALEENPNTNTRPEKLRVMTKGGASFDVYRPVVAGDTLRGWSDAQRTTPVAFPVSDVATARTRQLNEARTFLAIAGSAVGALVILSAIVWASFLASIQ